MKPVHFVPAVLQWARERAGLDVAYLAQRMKVPSEEVQRWEKTGDLTLSRAKKLASYARTPFGYLFLSEPLSDALPIPDFRTVGDEPLRHPSPDLLETIYTMQRRQEWMRDFLIEEAVDTLPFVGSAKDHDTPEHIAEEMRKVLGITADWANKRLGWADALRHLRQQVEAAGILIFINGIVGNNTSRKLDPNEFRGFVLSDAYAPLIFINGADVQSAQMFTIAHELTHVWLGQDGVSNFDAMLASTQKIESYCNAVAAEFLVPEREIRKIWPGSEKEAEPFQYVARFFKVSSLVAARRCLDLNLINKNRFLAFYEHYMTDERRKQKAKSKGGDFWKTQNVRIGFRFGSAVVMAAKEGRLLYNDAYKLTGLSGLTFEKYASTIGLPLK